MKINLPVSGIEKSFPSGAIVSKTDLKGAITYANDAFIDLSGFNREELIGKNHNLVRHPEMPAAAFAWLWGTVKTGQPWRGIVKNRCKNGDHYWVEAFVVPVKEKGEIVEYMSVRSPPAREQVAEAASSTADISRMVAEIENTTDVATGSMEQAVCEVKSGLAMIQASSESFKAITTASLRVSEMAQHIAGAASQQSIAGEEVAANMEQISAISGASTASAIQMGRATEELAHVAANLQALARHFDGGN